MAWEGCPRPFVAAVKLYLESVSESDELAEIFDCFFWWQDLDAHPLYYVVREMFLFSWGSVASRALLLV